MVQGLKKYHIVAHQSWSSFSHDGVDYCLRHLTAHDVVFIGEKRSYKFIVTYGLHCFAKDDQEHSISTTYSDNHEKRQINLERYHLSKSLRGVIESLDSKKLLYETTKEKYFTFEQMNDLTGDQERCKVCLCVFKENRLLRIHVTSAFFDRSYTEPHQKGFSIYKIALDTEMKPRTQEIPKEASRGNG